MRLEWAPRVQRQKARFWIMSVKPARTQLVVPKGKGGAGASIHPARFFEVIRSNLSACGVAKTGEVSCGVLYRRELRDPKVLYSVKQIAS